MVEPHQTKNKYFSGKAGVMNQLCRVSKALNARAFTILRHPHWRASSTCFVDRAPS